MKSVILILRGSKQTIQNKFFEDIELFRRKQVDFRIDRTKRELHFKNMTYMYKSGPDVRAEHLAGYLFDQIEGRAWLNMELWGFSETRLKANRK